MPALFDRAAGTGPGRDLFLEKLNMIHEKVQEVRYQRAQEAGEKRALRAGGKDLIIADDPT